MPGTFSADSFAGCPMPFGPVRAYGAIPPIHEDTGVYAARRAQGIPATFLSGKTAKIPDGADKKPLPSGKKAEFPDERPVTIFMIGLFAN